MYFRGRSFRSLDPKGRLMLPPDFRDILVSRCAEGKLIITTFDGCLVGFPLPDWEEFEEAFGRVENSSRILRDFRRLVIGGAEEVTIDNQGRARLSQDHRGYADLDKDVVLIGQLSRFEIWSPSRFNSIYEQNFDQVNEELIKSGVKFLI